MPIRIVSKREGFWRCGMQHSTTPKVYPDGFFTPEQLQRLKAEPMLIVDELPAEVQPAKSEPATSEPEASKAKAGAKSAKGD